MLLAFAVLLAAGIRAPAAERWRVQYFYDADASLLTITDFQFPTAVRGMAIGFLTEGKKIRPTGLVTSDGGETWKTIRVPDGALTLFLLDDSIGWVVSEKGDIWRTGEFGLNWRKLKRLSGVERVYFRNEKDGWAIGARKAVFETHDGGSEWTRVAAADQPKTTRDFTVYSWITFADPADGIIVGWSKAPRRTGEHPLPDWINPDERRREWPSVGISLSTRDGGKSWTASETSMFGQITRVRFGEGGRGLGLVEFADAFEWPAEVFRIDSKTGRSERVFRRKDRAATDIALGPRGWAYVAAIEPVGSLYPSPVPGKLKILRSDNFKAWTEIPVDYRAVGRRAFLAGPPGGPLWVATDTGMILKLVE